MTTVAVLRPRTQKPNRRPAVSRQIREAAPALSDWDRRCLGNAAAYFRAKGTLSPGRLREMAAQRPDLPDLLLLASAMEDLSPAGTP